MPDLLYYPRINAPRSVIYQGLLYWDHLITVVPPGPPEVFLDPEMRQVHDAGLYQPLRADGWPGLPDGDLNHALTQLAGRLHSIPVDYLIPHDGPDSYLHEAKLSRHVVWTLENRGLVRRDGDGFRISAAVELCLISIAARDIAGSVHERGGRAVYPFTDSPAAHLFAHTPTSYPDYTVWPREQIVPCWEVQIGELLPVPSFEVQIADVLRFREQYNDERQRLMLAIDRLVHGLQLHSDRPHEVLHAVRLELEQALADLEAAGRSARIDWVRKSVTISIALMAAYAGQRLVPGAGWILGVIGGAAVNVATTQTKSVGDVRAGDFSYLHRVERALAES